MEQGSQHVVSSRDNTDRDAFYGDPRMDQNVRAPGQGPSNLRLHCYRALLRIHPRHSLIVSMLATREGMLATENPPGPFSRRNLGSFVHSRSHAGGAHSHSHSPFVTAGMPSQTNRFTQGATRSDANGAWQTLQSSQVSPTSKPAHGSSATNTPSGSAPLAGSSDAPQREDNIMNRRADGNSSLYQICINLRRRLAEVPRFDRHIREMELEEEEAGDSTDPVTSMWNCLRRGYPLMTIYNALRPETPLHVDEKRVAEKQIGKAATFKFLQACLEDLKFPPNECFLITDLYGGDTTGFVKVTKVVNRVLDILNQKGLLLHLEQDPSNSIETEGPKKKRSHRQNVVLELVTTERDYVQHLETLQQFKNQVEEAGVISGDAAHDIFLNLNNLLDFQRRFLIRVEQQNTLPESQQNWGRLFTQYKESFRCYEPFIANQVRCNETVSREWDKIRTTPVTPATQDMTSTHAMLTGFLLKPFQRLAKYPLLLSDLRKNGDLDEERKADLQDGVNAANAVLIRANDAVDKEQLMTAVVELQSRVEDWKGHNIEHFGDLKLYGSFTVLKGDGQKEVEREVRMLFSAFDPLSQAAIRQAIPQAPILPQTPQSAVPPSARDGLLFSDASWSSVPYTGQLPTVANPTPKLEDAAQEQNFARQSDKDSSSFPALSMKAHKFTFSKKFKSKSLALAPRLKHSRDGFGDYGTPSRKSKFNHRGALNRFNEEHSDVSESSTVKKWKGSEHSARESFRMFDLEAFKSPFYFDGPVQNGTELLNNTPVKYNMFSQKPSKKLENQVTDEEGIRSPWCKQYKVYLFERILLCCKEINPNKPKNRLGNNKSLVDKKGKLRLQLKGRIFMQNVTDVVSFSKHGKHSHVLVIRSPGFWIFWKGDPGVENFVIRFSNEELMSKWRNQVEAHKKSLNGTTRVSGTTGTSETEFTYLKNQAVLQNPYKQEDDGEDDDDQAPYGSEGIVMTGQSEFTVSRNASSTSLRSRSTTGGSGPSTTQPTNRAPPPRFPIPEYLQSANGTPLTVHTNFPAPMPSPNDRGGNSYFSPTVDSPVSFRSSQTSMFPFPRQPTPNQGWISEDNNRKTAPALPRPQYSDGQSPLNGYSLNGRKVERPSLPVLGPSQSAHQMSLMQSRMRSASSPDIHNPAANAPRRYPNGQIQPSIEDVPVPPIPAHMQVRTTVSRNQNNPPTSNPIPIRSATQSPKLARSQYPGQLTYDQQQPVDSRPPIRSATTMVTPVSGIDQTHMVPPIFAPASEVNDRPSQVKVKIFFDDAQNYVTIVVSTNIQHQSLIDRIDSKLEKVSSGSISKGSARLRYRDSDGDMVSINSQEDFGMAVEDWTEAHKDDIRTSIIPDLALEWTKV